MMGKRTFGLELVVFSKCYAGETESPRAYLCLDEDALRHELQACNPRVSYTPSERISLL